MVDTDAFFLSEYQGRVYRMTAQALRQAMKRHCGRCGLPVYTPHQLRHHFATKAVENGAGELWLQLMLGHEIGSSETKRYIHSNTVRLRREYDRVFNR